MSENFFVSLCSFFVDCFSLSLSMWLLSNFQLLYRVYWLQRDNQVNTSYNSV